MKNPDLRAKELHEKIKDKRKKDQITTAVGNTSQNIAIIGTSDIYLRKEIRDSLFQYEIEAKSKIGNHAEQNIIEEAIKQNLTVTEIGASRDICIDCQDILESMNIVAKTPFSGKKSKNRI